VKVFVSVAPVVVVPGTADQPPTLKAFVAAGGSWHTRRIHDSPQQAAEALFRESVPALISDLVAPDGQQIQPVTFAVGEHDQSAITLIYTVALPMALGAALNAYSDTAGPDVPRTDVAWGDRDRWRTVCATSPNKDAAKDAGSRAISTDVDHAATILDFWRQQLEETAAATYFLAEYFTLPQLRDIYSAVWGYEQDSSSFNKWVRDALEYRAISLAAPAESPQSESNKDPDLTDDLLKALGTPAHIHEPLRRALKRMKFVGVSRTVIKALGPLAEEFIPLDHVVLAGSTVAYQSIAQGPKPTWYRRAVANPSGLRVTSVYPPRPAWENPPRAG
jgi:hypothetical protein